MACLCKVVTTPLSFPRLLVSASVALKLFSDLTSEKKGQIFRFVFPGINSEKIYWLYWYSLVFFFEDILKNPDLFFILSIETLIHFTASFLNFSDSYAFTFYIVQPSQR